MYFRFQPCFSTRDDIRFDLLNDLVEVRNLIFNRSAVNVKNGNSFIFFNRSKMLTFNLTVRCGCSYWGGYIHGSEDSRLLRSVTHVQYFR